MHRASHNACLLAYLHIIAARRERFVDFFRANGLVCLIGYNKTKESHFQFIMPSESFKISIKTTSKENLFKKRQGGQLLLVVLNIARFLGCKRKSGQKDMNLKSKSDLLLFGQDGSSGQQELLG